MNGSLILPLSDTQYFTVFGGPYALKPSHMSGVRMARELNLPADVVVPTQDFSVPNKEELEEGLDRAVTLMLLGRPVYIGCMGGIGRTGLFMAVLAKAFGITDPVAYVRKNYMPHAVETQAQKRFVAEFVIPNWTRKKLQLARVLFAFSKKKHLTKV